MVEISVRFVLFFCQGAKEKELTEVGIVLKF